MAAFIVRAFAPTLFEHCELTGVTDVNIGKWYDPISQHWIVPRKAAPVTPRAAAAEQMVEPGTRNEAERIWHLLVDCCARG